MSDTTTGIDLYAAQLDRLEALARKADDDKDGWRYYTAFQEAFLPATVLQLIQLARRSTSGSAASSVFANSEHAASGSDTAAYNAQLRQEVSIIYQMLDDGEWGEHIATTAHGQNLETAITKLVGKANAACIGASGSDGIAAADVAELESRIVELRTALRQISETRFGWDGDCGVTKIADDAIYADEKAEAPSGSEQAPASQPAATVVATDIYNKVLDALNNHLPYPTEACAIVRAVERGLPIPPAPTRQPLADEQIITVLHSRGIDTHPSKYGFNALQVSAMSLPNLRGVIEACATLAQPIVSPAIEQQAGEPIKQKLTDEQYQEILRPVLSRYGMQRYLNGDEITLNPSDYRAIIDGTRNTTAPTPAAEAVRDASEFVKAIAHNYDVYDEGDDERYCRGCSALVTGNGATNHQPGCIVPRAQAWLAAMSASQAKTGGAA